MKHLLLTALLLASTASCTMSSFDNVEVSTPSKAAVSAVAIQQGKVVTQGGVTWTIDSAGQVFRDGKALVCNAQRNCLIESRELRVVRDVLFVRNWGVWYRWVGGANGHFLDAGTVMPE